MKHKNWCFVNQITQNAISIKKVFFTIYAKCVHILLQFIYFGVIIEYRYRGMLAQRNLK
jgi:hypothetical protein